MISAEHVFCFYKSGILVYWTKQAWISSSQQENSELRMVPTNWDNEAGLWLLVIQKTTQPGWKQMSWCIRQHVLYETRSIDAPGNIARNTGGILSHNMDSYVRMNTENRQTQKCIAHGATKSTTCKVWWVQWYTCCSHVVLLRRRNTALRAI